jgi:hypothetical protein
LRDDERGSRLLFLRDDRSGGPFLYPFIAAERRERQNQRCR